MLDLVQLKKDILALEAGDDTSRRHILQYLRQYDQEAWDTVPTEVRDSIVTALNRLLLVVNKQPFVQKDAATILGNIGGRATSVIPQLIELLQKGVSDAVREAAATALGKMGKEATAAVDQLVELVADSRPVLTAQAIRALGMIGCADKRVRTALANRWVAPVQLQSSDIQLAIALCKLRIPAENLVETLTRTLMVNQEASFRKAAAEALTWCSKNDTDVVPALLSASLGDSSEEVRQMAQAALDQMKVSPAQATEVCTRQMGFSCYAETALRRSGSLAVPSLIEMLDAEDAAIRLKAARTLGFLDEVAAEAGPALAARAQDKDLEVRLAVVKGLWNVTKKPDVAVPALVALLDGKGVRGLEDSETRRRFLQTVMEALGRIGPPAIAAVSSLTTLTKDSNRHIREAALFTLQKIGSGAATKTGAR